MTRPTGDGPGAPERPLPPSCRIEIYARDEGHRIRIISDATEVEDADLIDVLPFDTQGEADAIARKCADFLTLSKHMGPDREGWHTLPNGVTPMQFMSTLFNAARNAAWADRAPAVGLEPEEAELPRTVLPAAPVAVMDGEDIEPLVALPAVVVTSPVRARRTRAPRTWTRERDRALVEVILTGYSAKEAAADPRLTGISVDSIYQRASEIGMSFRPSPQVTVRGLPSSVLAVFDRAALSCQKTRDGFVRALLMKIAADPLRYPLDSGF